MAQTLNTSTNKLSLTLTGDQKLGLQREADTHGFRSVSALIGAIGDGKVRTMTKREGMLLDYIESELRKRV